MTRISMDNRTKEKLDDWLEEIHEIWEDLQEE
jgi:CRISPR/Cas system-associated exonuclease Cas4 (RecB family)